jgi:phosphoglycolate phosphatase-like HAD superfamily hydrolase
MSRVAAVLYDIDGTLITTGGAGAAAWRHAFDELASGHFTGAELAAAGADSVLDSLEQELPL